MSNILFQKQLHAYTQWRKQLADAIGRYRLWLEKYKLNESKTDEKILNILDRITNDRVTLAFAAEFSRGKTELINALFFAETGVRLLPSAPGRTTMCPTELFFDHAGGNYIALLPIETRLTDRSLAEYKREADSWTRIELNCDSPAQMQEAFQELIAVKKVAIDQARELGLLYEEPKNRGGQVAQTIEIPRWRHALISFPHHLLKEGLAILDTPGLNALGSEPELTINMLPNAQAIIFVLAADTGVTKSDLDMWQNHIRGHRGTQKKGLAVVMNKIDTLWDDLAGEDKLQQSIESQVQESAKILEIDSQLIFPVSAKQALLAKIKADNPLLKRSRLGELEKFLSEDMLKGRQQLLMASVTHEIGFMVYETSNATTQRLEELTKELDTMRQLSGDNKDMTEKLMMETREEQSRYLAYVENFQASQRVFSVQARLLTEALSPDRADTIILRTKKEMAGCLTTMGIKKVMRDVFNELRGMFSEALDLTDETRRLVNAVYKKFQGYQEFKGVTPKLFSIASYQEELEQIFNQGEAFRNSAAMPMMEQRWVVQKLYNSIVLRARELFDQAHQDAENWSITVLSPIIRQIKDHKKMIETRLEMLRKINSAEEDIETTISKLEKQLIPLQKQHDELETIKIAMSFDKMNLKLDHSNARANMGRPPLAAQG